jgi:hypothetical protein
MTVTRFQFYRLTLALSGAALIACSALAGTPSTTIVFTEIAGHPTSAAPGMLDLAGNPVAAKFDALFDFAISPDGSQWIIRADTDLPTTHDQVLLLGNSNGTYTVIAQDGRPVQGGAAGELWDFFDSDYPGSFDEAGNFAFSGRAKNGVSAVKEKLVKVINGVYTIVLTESTPVTNIFDIPANPTGDELVGNSIGSVSLRNDGGIFFGNTPIQNCSSFRYPALFIDTVGFRQSGVSTIGFETWDSFGFGDCGMAPNGSNWYALGDTENPDTTVDAIFAVNDIKVAQENSPLGATGITTGASPFFFCRMNANGAWFLRGDDTADNDWAITGTGDTWSLVTKTGDPITTPLQGPAENWAAVFTAFHGNSKGDWVLTGNTTNANLATDDVLVLNGTEVILREGDPIDLDGNGQFDDDVFVGNNPTSATLRAFHANDLLITDDMIIHAFVTLRNGAGTVLGDAYLQIDVAPAGPVCPADINGDQQVGVSDLLAVIGAWGPCGGTCPPACTGDVNADCNVGVADLLAVISAWGPCP